MYYWFWDSTGEVVAESMKLVIYFLWWFDRYFYLLKRDSVYNIMAAIHSVLWYCFLLCSSRIPWGNCENDHAHILFCSHAFMHKPSGNVQSYSSLFSIDVNKIETKHKEHSQLHLTISPSHFWQQYTTCIFWKSWMNCFLEWFPYCMKNKKHDFLFAMISWTSMLLLNIRYLEGSC